jgi:hypothetical protein
MNGQTPTRKVGIGAVAGALSVIVVWGISFIVDVPAEIASAFTTILTFAVAWFVPDSSVE